MANKNDCSTTFLKVGMKLPDAERLVNCLIDKNITINGTVLLAMIGSKQMYEILIKKCSSNAKIIIADSDLVTDYFENYKNIMCININENDADDFYNKLKNMPKFDFVVQNPPYGQKSPLHLKFLEKGLDLLSVKGQMIIIEPAIHLINVRNNKTFNNIKDKINNIVEKIVIDNYTKEFCSSQRSLFAITYINNAKKNNKIKFKCCGDTEITVNNIYDCNLIGNYKLLWSILHKIQSYGDMFRRHIADHNKINYSNDDWFLQRSTMMPAHGYYSNIDYIKHSFGEYYGTYSTFVSHKDNFIPTKEIGYKQSSKKNLWDCTFGKREELNNLVYNNLNTKLFCFIQCVMAINTKGNSEDFIPWLVDKKYTDQEIYDMFNFTDAEIKLIETTIKKYERNSPWFKRYMCGPSEVTDEEVQKFIKDLNNAKG